VLTKLESFNIPTEDPEAFVKFYRDKLGVPCLFGGFGGYDGAQLGFDKDHPKIIVWDVNRWNGEKVKVEFAFGCRNLKETANDLKLVEIDFKLSSDCKEIELRDPNGNKILILEE
jgi:catechol 2,3-dioxygenase-like lactoylglutathione lyase family enzyme